MSEHVLLIENPKDWKPHFPRVPIVSARDYLTEPQYGAQAQLKVINLCRSYRYLSVGYYCSLLAEARGHKVIPTVRTIQDLSRRSIYSLRTEDLDTAVQKALSPRAKSPLQTVAYELSIYFGQCGSKGLEELSRQIFETFRSPLLKVEFRRQDNWRIAAIKALAVTTLSTEQETEFLASLEGYLSRRWRQPRTHHCARYDLAMLHDPAEVLPPSNKRALKAFVRAGKACGVNVEPIERRDFGKLAEYDALFIRETTQIGHHTYRFAKKAESEGMVVIDDPDSILRCTNKVFLAELLQANRVNTPRTMVVSEANLAEVEDQIGFPAVLKIPDSSFSRGVFKADNPNELRAIAMRLFRSSELILAQEFMYTQFDWRVGILGRRPLYVCRYYMSEHHWQILDHSAGGHPKEGNAETLRVEDSPREVVKAALRAANLIGDGLYGVDLKQTERGVMVIEVNDNPNIDAGVEDRALGDQLYRLIIENFVERLERKRGGRAR